MAALSPVRLCTRIVIEKSKIMHNGKKHIHVCIVCTLTTSTLSSQIATEHVETVEIHTYMYTQHSLNVINK